MAAALYPKWKEFLLAELLSANVKIVLIDTSAYTYSTAHDFLDDIPVGARIATSGNLASKTATNGTFDAADISIAGVTGATVEAIAYYIDTGNAATSRIVFYDDTLTGLVYTPNGGQANITFNPSGIFTL